MTLLIPIDFVSVQNWVISWFQRTDLKEDEKVEKIEDWVNDEVVNQLVER